VDSIKVTGKYFDIESVEGRTYHFCASDDSAARSWCEEIRQGIFSLKRPLGTILDADLDRLAAQRNQHSFDENELDADLMRVGAERAQRAQTELRRSTSSGSVKMVDPAIVDSEGAPQPCRSALADKVNLALLVPHLPANVRNHQWRRLYSVAEHGTSMRVLLHRCSAAKEACVTLIEDMNGCIFGAFHMKTWEIGPRQGKMPYGTLANAVFTYNGGELSFFKATGANELFQTTSDKELSLGGGGAGYGLWLKDGFLQGTSAPCDTYGSPCLASEECFTPRNIEVWGLGWKKIDPKKLR